MVGLVNPGIVWLLNLKAPFTDKSDPLFRKSNVQQKVEMISTLHAKPALASQAVEMPKLLRSSALR